MRKIKRGIAWLICLVMLISMLPTVSLAADPEVSREGNDLNAAISANPYLPMWEHIPDGEPRVFTDPETGEQRLYIYGSHDSFSSTYRYCGTDHVTWSAPLDDLTNWRPEGTLIDTSAFKDIHFIDANGVEQTITENSNRVLYAPDVIYYPDDQTYYMFLFPNPDNKIFVATSKSPAGPFTNPQYICEGFDPAALVDDELDENGNHRVYLYYSTEKGRDGFACELDPKNGMMMKPGTLHYPDTYKTNADADIVAKSTMLSKNLAPFHFFEGPSIRKINDWYLLSYQRSAPTNPENTGNGKLAEIGWAYSKNPYGDPNYPDAELADEWHYGGVIVSNLGENVANPYAADPANPDYIDTFFGQNTHGGMVQINDQWYQIYHRATGNGMKRQSMIEPFEMKFDPVDGHPIIEQVEMTSQGFNINGLDPFQTYYASIACYEIGGTAGWWSSYPVFFCTGDNNYDPNGTHGDWYPVQDVRHHTWLGYKYYNFGKGYDGLQLDLSVKENSAGTVNVYANDPKSGYEDTEKPKTLIGSADFTGENKDEHIISVELDASKLTGKKGIYLEFIAANGTNSAKLVDLNKLQFVETEAPVVMHTVTFDYNFPGAPDPVVVKVADGATVTAIEAPKRVGYALNSWGTEMSWWGMTFITPYNFSNPVTADLTLKASWGKDWSMVYSLADEYADFLAFGNFGTQSPNGGQAEHEYRTFSGNSGKMTYNFGANESKNAYNEAVAAINADTTLTEEEKAAKILEAEGKVLLGANNPLANDLNRIQQWNADHPDEPKKYYRQHVIAWHGSEQNAAFYHMGFDTSKPLATKEIMNARLDSYIEAMFKRYQPWDDIIMSWDIVNEALDDYNGMVRNGWNGTSWGETNLDDASNQSSAWGTIYRMKDENGNPVTELSDERLLYESEWIRVAFASARKWQKELGVHWTLYYNDYMNSSMLYEPKMTNTLKMLKPISEAGNLDGYGMQARLATAYPTIEMLRNQIEEGLKLADEVSFSEADLRTDFEVNPLYDPEKPTVRVTSGVEEWDEGGSGSYSRRSQQNGNTYDVSNGPVRRKADFNANDPETMRIQADYYADLMDIVLEKAAEGKFTAVAIDGTSDASTFNRNTGCQIWDSSSNEKPAFFAVIGAPNRFKMGQAIEAGPAASEKSKYTADSWAVYAAALDAAEALVDVRIYDAEGVEAVKAATADLIAATEALVEEEAEGVFIDFTNLDDAEKFDIVGQATAAIAEGVGLPLVSTKTGVEPANGQNSGDAATTPADLVEVPVEGDWTATLNFAFDQNGSQGWYEFFGFYASEGDDYQNMAGIRGGDGAMQDFLRKAGAVTADTDGVKTSTGLKSAADHWLRIVKEGDKYICYWSTTGEENLAEIFSYDATGIEADKLIIDAYTGMAAGYKYTLKSLDIESPAEPVVMHTVTFDYNFPSAPDPVVVKVADGATVEPIEAPDREGYDFASWGTEFSWWGFTFSTPYDFATPVTADITLKASWNKDWTMVPSLYKSYDGYFLQGSFGGSIGNAQTDAHYATLSGGNGKLTYNIGGGREDSGAGTTSRTAYEAAVAAINADDSLSAEEKAAKIEEANRDVQLIEGEPAVFSTLRAIRQWNEEHPDDKKYYRQHVMAWHGSEQPKYFFCNGFYYDAENPDWASPETMLARLDNYIHKMIDRHAEFDDVIISWDIVNEAIDDYSGQIRNYEDYQVSEWGMIFRRPDLDNDPDARLEAESAWVRQAFESARKWTDAAGCHWKLYYNDFQDSDKLYEPKMSQTVKMLKPIYEAGNIDGYGMQGRLAYAYPTIDMLREQIELGLTVADEISFSEADIRSDFEPNPNYDPTQPTRRVTADDPEWPENSGSFTNIGSDNGNTFDVHNSPVYRNPDWGMGALSDLANSPEIMTKQADFAADLMDLLLEYHDKVVAVAWDGNNDNITFNRTTGCSMWDKNSNEKYSFFAIIGAPRRYELREAIAAGPAATEEGKYTADSWAVYAAAKDAAEALVDVRIYDLDAVNAVTDATDALVEATKALVEEATVCDHDYEAVFTAPTCTEDGYTTYTCSKCGDSYIADEVEALGHDYVDGVCTRCGKAQDSAAEEALEAALAAQKAAEAAKKAAEAAEAAAEEAAKAAAADSTAAEAAKKAAEEAEKKAEAAQAAADSAKKAAEAADTDAAIKAAESAASAAESAASAAEAAKAQAAAAQAQAKAEVAEKAAEEAQKKADEAAQKGEAAADEAAAAQKAAEEAKKAAQDAKNAADLSAAAADKANAEAAEAAAKAAAEAAKIADALKEVASAQAEVADALEKAAKEATEADAARKAAEAAQKAAEEAMAAAQAAELNAAKYNALTQVALAAAAAEDADPAVVEAGIKAIEDAKDIAAVDAALADLLEKLGSAEIDCPSADFIDASEKGNWAHEGIDFCVANGYMNGTSANVFTPAGTVTRAQLVTILYRVAGEPETEFKATFSDVADGLWYSNAIEWAAANEVVNGVGEGKFNPMGAITREQIAAILYRYSKAAKVEGDLKAFPDGDTASTYAIDALVWAAQEGLITGIKSGDETKLAPKDNATRAQIAAIIMRFLNGSYDCK